MLGISQATVRSQKSKTYCLFLDNFLTQSHGKTKLPKDMAVMFGKERITTNDYDEKFGVFESEEVNLFSAGDVLPRKASLIKSKAAELQLSEEYSDSQKCGDLLSEFYTLDSMNNESHQLTVDQVCDSIDSFTKLVSLFSGPDTTLHIDQVSPEDDLTLNLCRVTMTCARPTIKQHRVCLKLSATMTAPRSLPVHLLTRRKKRSFNGIRS